MHLKWVCLCWPSPPTPAVVAVWLLQQEKFIFDEPVSYVWTACLYQPCPPHQHM